MPDYTFAAQMKDKTTGQAKNGITVTVDIGRAGVTGVVAADQVPTDLGWGGFFVLTYSTAAADDWFANFKTADTSVEAVHLGSWAAKELPFLDVASSTLLPAASYVAPDNAGIAAIKAKTDNLPDDPASVSDLANISVDVWSDIITGVQTAQDIMERLSGLLAVFNGATRTLTMTPSQITALADGEMEILRGDTYIHAFSNLGSLAGRSSLAFTVKSDLYATDDKSTIHITETGGLVRLNGQPGVGANASLVVTDENTGNALLTIHADATFALPVVEGLSYDVQVKIGNLVHTREKGTLRIVPDVTRSIS